MKMTKSVVHESNAKTQQQHENSGLVLVQHGSELCMEMIPVGCVYLRQEDTEQNQFSVFSKKRR